MTAPLAHIAVAGSDFMPSGWCGGCDNCGPAPTICLACSYGTDGMPTEPVAWPCSHASADRYPPGGCVLTDKTRCSLPKATCCDEGAAIRWPAVPVPGTAEPAPGEEHRDAPVDL